MVFYQFRKVTVSVWTAILAIRTFLLVNKSLNFVLRDPEYTLDDVRSASDDVLDVILANLVVKLLQYFLFVASKLLFKVFQLPSLVVADVDAT